MFTPQSDTENLPLSVLHISAIFARSDVKTWLCYGALLGMIREGRLLPWNNDVELGFVSNKLSSSTIRSILRTLASHGYIATYYSTSRSFSVWHPRLAIQVNINHFADNGTFLGRPHETCSQPGNGASLLAQFFWWLSTILGAKVEFQLHDLPFIPLVRLIRILLIFFIQKFPLFLRSTLSYLIYTALYQFIPSSKTMIIPREFIFPLSSLEFYGGQISSPKQPNELLRYLYGDTWNIPKENWSFYHTENRSESRVQYLDIPHEISSWFA